MAPYEAFILTGGRSQEDSYEMESRCHDPISHAAGSLGLAIVFVRTNSKAALAERTARGAIRAGDGARDSEGRNSRRSARQHENVCLQVSGRQPQTARCCLFRPTQEQLAAVPRWRKSKPLGDPGEFQFAKGYLEKGRVSEIEDTISQLLSLEEGADQQSQPAQNGGDVLTNSDVVKMVKAKLGDGIIISTVRSSACNFDTSVNGMVKLKEAGVSDPVIQAMRDAQDASNAAANDQGPAPTSNTQSAQPEGPPPVPGQLSFSVKHRHSFFWNPGTSDVEYYCSGTLSVTPDGTVAYECTQTDDPSGRCEHLSFAPGSLKQVKIGLAGNLHLASKTQGNFDFYGNRNDIKQAQAALLR